ncbi:MAG: hypothetical protein RL410_568 [Actinomycetota bacterium]|jgi:hypothetical protein
MLTHAYTALRLWDRTKQSARLLVGAELRLLATPMEGRLVEVGF